MSSLSILTRQYILLAVAVVMTGAAFFVPPVAQDLAYHDFADHRAIWGIPNFCDVLSNLPFAVVGIWGGMVLWCQRAQMVDVAALRLWAIFFGGVFLVAFGSGYYHWAPDNHTLVWDRLPMTIAFMSLFSLIVMERVSRRAGLTLFPWLLFIGMASVFYWDYTETLGQGDLRPYALVQFLPMVLIVLILCLFPSALGGTRWLGGCLGFYLLAKVLEHFDDAFFGLFAGVISGHSLKHMAAAAGVACLIPYVRLYAAPRAT